MQPIILYTGINQIGQIEIVGDPNSPYTPTYDANGNMTSDGMGNTFAWDRANRLSSMGGISYAYNGLGNRLSQDNGVDVTQYLLDLQPGLAVVLSATTGANVNRYIHSRRGIHAQEDNAGNWNWMLQDGLGSIRSVASDALAVQETRLYDPYGNPFATTGTEQTDYGFTGEWTDPNDLINLRNRAYASGLGVFASLDKLESLNRYAYALGNPVNRVDRNGLQSECVFGEGVLFGCGGFGQGDDTNGAAGLPLDLSRPTLLDIEQFLNQSGQGQGTGTKERKRHPLEEVELPPLQPPQLPPDIPRIKEDEKCDCNSLPNPAGFALFNEGDNGEDILCNLRCFTGSTGPDPEQLYRSRLAGVNIQIIHQSVGVVEGLFTGTAITLPETFRDADLAGMAFTNPIGTIAVRQPRQSSIQDRRRTRASRVAALVEEIRHASQFYNLFTPTVPPCEQLSLREAERDAKSYVHQWIKNSTIGIGSFVNIPEREEGGIAIALERTEELLGTSRMDSRAFLSCPGESPTIASFPILRLGVSNAGIRCINPFIARILVSLF